MVNSHKKPIAPGQIAFMATHMHRQAMNTPKCGQAESPDNECYTYVQTKQHLDESKASPYEVPTTLATSK